MDEIKILGLVAGMNAGLSILSKILAVFKDRTKNKIDNKLYAFIGKVLGYSQKAVDVVSGNVQH